MTPPWKGLDPARAPVFISHDRAGQLLAALLDAAARFQPDQVVGVMRGGIVPASMAASLLGLDLALVGFDRPTRTTRELTEITGRRLLIVDDGASSGRTLADVRAALGRDSLTLALVHDPETCAIIPDLSHPMTALWRFPWERGEATPAGRALRASGAGPDRTTEQSFTAISARGYRPQAPERSISLAATTAADKAAEATRLGCTHLVEENAAEALRIAAAAPHLIVSWWSAEAGAGYIVSACRMKAGD